jgi:superfamily II DNA or RNA helicase
LPRIFDNIDLKLVSALKDNLPHASRMDASVGYFNLRGWRLLDRLVEELPEEDGNLPRCRLIVGMQRSPQEDLRRALSLVSGGEQMSNREALRLVKRATEEFREQLQIGAPTGEDERGLRRLSEQLRSGTLVVKLHLRHPLHAKLYLLHRDHDPNLPAVGFVGSSNLTPSGLVRQGELNVDVLDHDATGKLADWFEERWADQWCVDVTEELADLIDASWAREEPLSPYFLYLKIAYHLSQEARAGLGEFGVPRDFGGTLLDFQSAAVRIAAHHLNRRGGVVIGDVVGLGKTLMAPALARVFQDDQGLETLIICPKNLTEMWEGYVVRHRLIAKVLPISRAIQQLPALRRYRLVILDESHNLRNPEGKRYRAIREYVAENDSRCILLSATPYNKTYNDLSAQLALFVPRDADLGIRPERAIKEIGETEFVRRHQATLRSLAAFEHSEHPADWRELMRIYLVRRTRGFVRDNYAETDPESGRRYLLFADGRKSYFPDRVPKTVPFSVSDPDDPYARLYSREVVDAVNALKLPRYGLGNYAAPAKPNGHDARTTGTAATAAVSPTADEERLLAGLGRAGQRLMGFCRTNLFKRLESSGPAFLRSVDRHAMRNFVVLHAIENGLPIPIGPQESEFLDGRASLDPASSDTDPELFNPDAGDAPDGETPDGGALDGFLPEASEERYRRRAADVYERYRGTSLRNRFKWISPGLFQRNLADDLLADARALVGVLVGFGGWDVDRDAKLKGLLDLVTRTHPEEKVLVFSQFADTVHYLAGELERRGVGRLAGVTGSSDDPTALARRFSPKSNEAGKDSVPPVPDYEELRVLVSTDVLSEGQNLQDCAVVVNFDLPWAIVQLIQRAGRVDRLGQESGEILCYSFLPAEGVERIIGLRQRVGARLKENAEVIGADETFFEDEADREALFALYHEKAGILEEDELDAEVDLASHAYQIWKNATDEDPSLLKKVPDMPDVVFATKDYLPSPSLPHGVLVYTKTAEGNDALAWVDANGEAATTSQLAILAAAECGPEEQPLERREDHHELVKRGVELTLEETAAAGGQLGRPSGARFRTYERLKGYADGVREVRCRTPKSSGGPSTTCTATPFASPPRTPSTASSAAG